MIHTHTHTDVGENRIFHIGLVADQDENSKVDSVTWGSWLKTGTLTLHHDRTLSVKWDTDLVPLRSHISEKGRGVELSELIVFNGRLYTVDDRSGISESVDGCACIFSEQCCVQGLVLLLTLIRLVTCLLYLPLYCLRIS